VSRISAVEVQNFMSIGKARVEFDESNIISLCGYNDSGKSAITRALEVLFYNAYPNDQAKFIKDGEDYFGVGLEDENGVNINYYKYRSGKSIWEMSQGGKLLYTNRLANGVVAVSDIPVEIAEYFGVIQDEITGEKLNVRRNTDRLFLINTTGGDNYKILNSVLRSDLLAAASRKLNEDKNTLQSEVYSVAATLSTLRKELEEIDLVPEDIINLVEKNTENLAYSKTRLDYITSIKTQKDGISEFKEQPEICVVDAGRLQAMDTVKELKEKSSLSIHAELGTVDTFRHGYVVDILKYRGCIDDNIAPEAVLVDTDRFTQVSRLGSMYNDLYTVSTEVSAITSELNSVQEKLLSLAMEYGFKICPSCSTIVQ